MVTFSIRDLSELSGIKQHTIRMWEQRYSFLKPARFPNSLYRVYTVDDLHAVLNAALLSQNGIRISRVDAMPLEEKLLRASRVFDQQQRIIHELIIQMARMDVDGFEAALDTAVTNWGVHGAITQVLIPFCDMTGLLVINSTKNYVENILLVRQSIKQRIYAGIIDPAPGHRKARRVVFFLPPGELQELTLLCVQYLLQRDGYDTVYLGQQVPLSYVESICAQLKPGLIISHFARKPRSGKELCAFVGALPGSLPGTTFISIENALPLPHGAGSDYRHAAGISEVRSIVDATDVTEPVEG
ncbi:MerR family transcriptional regulator [Flaviaesturariibacter amylovorans]|uniref:HTH merR-type domain-containing protein n=1 Tax=Flaviaesturariibacter amylovorans TaxID=1084520 RepID=A0ABP8HSK1_9BACT